MAEEKEPYIVCLDPDSGLIYTLGLITNEVHVEKEIPPKIREKAKFTLKQLASLRDSSNTKWWFHPSSVDPYRRRRLESYLIHPDSAKYPSYEAHSALSLAFADE